MDFTTSRELTFRGHLVQSLVSSRSSLAHAVSFDALASSNRTLPFGFYGMSRSTVLEF